ncbi:hypothetical protein HELRODRAFT_167780 [Helobdella robusta]|uniref:Uncharacterized protein n=1 Tax=Helobdella robusta TaxID=6412 RepID=T1EZS6_HELRO|nr:hypothetical protein HELRODRAFT_167780 [Helobdella robusta]ESO09950.1 hypothetical protein HELRODRAFT_167780 [Helobdella robusta]
MVTTSNDLGKNIKDEASPLSLSSTSTTSSIAHAFENVSRRKVKNGKKVSGKKLYDKNKYNRSGANLLRNKTRELNENIDKVCGINEKSLIGKNSRKINHNKRSGQHKNILYDESKRHVYTDVNGESLRKETSATERSDCRSFVTSATRPAAEQIGNRPDFEHDRRNNNKKITESGSKMNVKNFTLEILTTGRTKPEKSEMFKNINSRLNRTKEAEIKNVNEEVKKYKRRTTPASMAQRSIPESSSTSKNAYSYSITTSGTISKSSLTRKIDSVAENNNKSNITNKGRTYESEAKDWKANTTADINNSNLLNGKETKVNLTELVGKEKHTNKNLKLYEQQNVPGANLNKNNFGLKDLTKYFTKDKGRSSTETKDQKEKSAKNPDKKKVSVETKDKKVENDDKGKEFLSSILDPASSNKNSKFSDPRTKRRSRLIVVAYEQEKYLPLSYIPFL